MMTSEEIKKDIKQLDDQKLQKMMESKQIQKDITLNEGGKQ